MIYRNQLIHQHIVRTTVGFREVRQLAKSRGVAKGNVYDAVVGERRHGSNHGRFLATTMTARGDEDATILAVELAL